MTKLKEGSSIIIMGYQGSGKSPVVKRLAKESGLINKVVFDPRHEYDENEFTIFYNFEKFRQYIFEVKNCFIIFEEASGYIGQFRELELINFIIGIEHNRNTVCFLFHSIKACPLYMLEYSHFLILLDTNDSPEFIRTQRPIMYEHIMSKKAGVDLYINTRQRPIQNEKPVKIDPEPEKKMDVKSEISEEKP